MWALLRPFGVPKTKLFRLGSDGLLPLRLPQRRISAPARQADAPKWRLIRPNVRLPTTQMWTLLAELRPFDVPETKRFLPDSYGRHRRLSPQRRISVPAHQVDGPKWRLIRPNVRLRPYSHRVRQAARLRQVDHPEVCRLIRHSHLRIRWNAVPRGDARRPVHSDSHSRDTRCHSRGNHCRRSHSRTRNHGKGCRPSHILPNPSHPSPSHGGSIGERRT